MLRQELQQTRESLAARDAEVQELKSRLAELERLQTDQQKLIALKDAELAAAQSRTVSAAAPATPTEAPSSSMLPWVGAGALVLIGLLAAAFARRRTKPVPARRMGDEPKPSVADAFAEPSTPVGAVAPAAPAKPATPSWESGAKSAKRAPAKAVAATAVAATPAWVEEQSALTPQVDPANADRLERAQAYLDVGDTERARALLGEVEASGDATARSVASRMRQGLG